MIAPVSSLLFYGPGGAWSQLLADEAICLFEHSPYCHVAGRVGDVVYEAIVTGVRARPYDPLGLDRDAESIPHALDEAFLIAQLGKPYDFAALGADVAARYLPHGMKIVDDDEDVWDCSRYIAVAAHLIDPDERGPMMPSDVHVLSTKGLPAMAENNTDNQEQIASAAIALARQLSEELSQLAQRVAFLESLPEPRSYANGRGNRVVPNTKDKRHEN